MLNYTCQYVVYYMINILWDPRLNIICETEIVFEHIFRKSIKITLLAISRCNTSLIEAHDLIQIFYYVKENLKNCLGN